MQKDLPYEELVKILCNAIKQRRWLHFYYESETTEKKEWREVIPYLIGINKKGNLELAGLPSTELSKKIQDRISGHYLLKIIDEKQFKVLSKTLKDPGVPRKRVVDTPTVQVICRFIYPDEDIATASSTWIKTW